MGMERGGGEGGSLTEKVRTSGVALRGERI